MPHRKKPDLERVVGAYTLHDAFLMLQATATPRAARAGACRIACGHDVGGYVVLVTTHADESALARRGQTRAEPSPAQEQDRGGDETAVGTDARPEPDTPVPGDTERDTRPIDTAVAPLDSFRLTSC